MLLSPSCCITKNCPLYSAASSCRTAQYKISHAYGHVTKHGLLKHQLDMTPKQSLRLAAQ
jgi:hypothetical protein